MRQQDLVPLLISAVVALFGIAVGLWKLLDARSASRVRAEQRRGDEALAREKTANARAERYEAQRDKAMEAAVERSGLLAALAAKVDALSSKIDGIPEALSGWKKAA